MFCHMLIFFFLLQSRLSGVRHGEQRHDNCWWIFVIQIGGAELQKGKGSLCTWLETSIERRRKQSDAYM
jgi:hypothetical protein